MTSAAKMKKVLYIDSEPSFLAQQKELLTCKELEEHLYPFGNIDEAFNFIEKQIIGKNNKLHYIVLDAKVMGNQLSNSLERFGGLNNYLKKPDVIVISDEINMLAKNHIMQYPFVSVFLVKPVPTNYIEFLITGQIS